MVLKTYSSTLATSCEELTHWKRLWCWEGLGARGEGDNRGWDGWMASLTWWTWISVNFRSWWGTGRPGVLWFMGLQRVGHDWANDLIWSDLKTYSKLGCHKSSIWKMQYLQNTTIWSTDGKESVFNAGSIPGSGSFSGGNGNPLQYSCLGNPMKRGTWWTTVHRVAKSGHHWVTHTFTFAMKYACNWIMSFWQLDNKQRVKNTALSYMP